MAALAHLGVGLAAKRLAPKIPLVFLIVAAWVIDIIWGVFFFAGVESLPAPGAVSPWSHGLFMAAVWSLLSVGVAWMISRNVRTSLFLGGMVFSHWVIDFISQPMGFTYPGSSGPPLLFQGSPTVGLGLYNSAVSTYIGEYGTLALGVGIYVWTLVTLRKKKNALTQGQM